MANPKKQAQNDQIFTKTRSIGFRSKLIQKIALKFEEKAIRKTEICKKQVNFSKNKPKNKQPASLQKNLQLHKKTSPNSQENRKVGNRDD